MKIAYLFFSFTRLAGTERILIDKMNYFADNMGYDVTVITYEQGEHPFVFPLSDKVHRKELNTRFFTLYRFNVVKRLWLTLKMRKLFYKRYNQVIAEINPDILICTTYRDFEIKAVANCPSSAIKIVESHTTKSDVLLIGNERIKDSRIQWLIAKFREFFMMKNIARFDCLVALTQSDADAWSKIVTSISIPNMVTSYPESILPRPCNKRAISVGRLSVMKGYDMLIDIWSNVHRVFPDWKLYIYGEGAERDNLVSMIRSHDLTGFVEICDATSDIYPMYLNSDIFLMSSRFEGFGLVLIEAMSCGLPCISFNCPNGPSSIIYEGENGYLIPMFDKKLYADRLCDLIGKEELRSLMSNAARETSAQYKPESIMRRWDDFFRKMLDKK